MNIGAVSVEHPLVLAPMAGVTSHPFRLLAREQGCGLVVSEMISARGLLHNGKRSRGLLYYSEAERPLAFQLFGSEPAVLARAAQKLEQWGADIIDLNLGCPTPKIVRNGDGGALMRDPQLCSAIFKEVAAAVSCPVTVKMRTGWDQGSLNAPEIARRAEEAGLQAVALHGRTVEQGYRGTADWDAIRQLRAAVGIPVIGNGDVISPRDALSMLDHCGCHGVMIGRAALGNPWIFGQVQGLLEGRLVDPPALQDRVTLALRHMALLGELKGEHTAVREMRRHAAFYIKALPGASVARQQLVKATSFNQLEETLRLFAKQVVETEREV